MLTRMQRDGQEKQGRLGQGRLGLGWLGEGRRHHERPLAA